MMGAGVAAAGLFLGRCAIPARAYHPARTRFRHSRERGNLRDLVKDGSGVIGGPGFPLSRE